MSDEEIKGKAKKTKGKIEENVGKATGDTSKQLKGAFNKATGKTEEELGKLKRKSK